MYEMKTVYEITIGYLDPQNDGNVKLTPKRN